MVRFADRLPISAGLNVRTIVVLPPAEIVIGSCRSAGRENSAAFVPPMARLEIVSGPVPVLLITSDRVLDASTHWLPKSRFWFALKPGWVPLPWSAMVCGAPGALSVTTRLAARLPVPDGEKVTFTVVVWPGLTFTGKAAVVKAKSPALAPVI